MAVVLTGVVVALGLVFTRVNREKPAKPERSEKVSA
jgi:hypothetical protein